MILPEKYPDRGIYVVVPIPYTPSCMSGIGILRSNSIELIDATLNDGSIFPTACPGDLNIPCTACAHAHDTGSRPAHKSRRRISTNEPQSSFIICHWHEQGDAKHTPPSSDAPS